MRAGARGGSLRSSNLHVNFRQDEEVAKSTWLRTSVERCASWRFHSAFDGVILDSLQASVAAPSALQVSAGEGPLTRAGSSPPPTLELARAPFCEKLVRR